MKKIFLSISLFILSVFGLVILANKADEYHLIKGPCSDPIKYSIGEVDPQFNIDREKMIAISQQGEQIWENSSGKNLFEYDPKAELKINLIFDERQQNTLESMKLKKDLKKINTFHESFSQEHDALVKKYNQKISAYNQAVGDYEKRLADYNREVEYWNKKGGAPEDEYEKLEKESKKLEAVRKNLEKDRQEVNSLAGQANRLAEKSNSLAEKFNAELETYNSKFGESKEFEKGLFDGKSINLYEFREESDLLATVIHEMGHALGIDHLENPQSIMHYMLGEQNLENIQLTEEDIRALKEACKMN